MTLVIRSIEVDSFRKFRKPFTIDGLTDGLNIVIEPNETGKSTLLEALRAAFFVRHNTRNQLAQSFAPHGEAVGPEVKIEFEIDNAPWSVTKRFLRSPLVEVIGPSGRAQGDEAETRLNTLLGAVKDTSRSGDLANYGALGLLWVAQMDALHLSAPGQIVRDTIASTLETEVGSIMGGEAYKRVRERVEAQFDLYWTPTGQKKGRQNEARERAEGAEASAREAAARLAELERSFAELEETRTRLKAVQREIADETDAQARRDLVSSLEIARTAAQILATRTAEHQAATGKLGSLSELCERHEEATSAKEAAVAALESVREQRRTGREAITSAKTNAATARADLENARIIRNEARAALASGEATVRQSQRGTAIAAALQRHESLLALEAQRSEAQILAATEIPAIQIAQLEEQDRVVAAAQAVLDAGATRITLSGQPDGVTIDGEPMPIGEHILTSEVRIESGKFELLISPPATAASAEETLASSLRKRQALLDEIGVADLAAARIRNSEARDAAAEVRTIDARITAETPAVDVLDLASGPEALKLFASELGDVEGGTPSETLALPDIAALFEALENAETAFAQAEGHQQSAIEVLQRAEKDDAPLGAIEAGAESDLANTGRSIESIESNPQWATLEAELPKAREEAAAAAVNLEQAKRDVTAHDVGAISRKIEVIDARVRGSAEARTKLETDIARLEGTIESEGGLGLGDRAAATQEEAEAARAALARVTEEAATIKLLRETLELARAETSAKFVGPVAKRAKRYIERLLPDCELSFSEDLALETVVRSGVEEHCESLSRGTQEQLAVLTRIAFADLLLEQGRPVSLILDDPLVYSDDGRLDTMIEILVEASSRMQVILLTCRDRAFRHVSANRLLM